MKRLRDLLRDGHRLVQWNGSLRDAIGIAQQAGGDGGVASARGGGAGVAAVGRIGVVIPEPPHQRRGEDVPVAVFLIGRPGHVRVHDRAYQQLP